MKIKTFVTTVVLCVGLLSTVKASNEISIYVNEDKLNLDVAPITENDRTLVPMRAIFEALDASVSWDDATETVTATKGEKVIVLTIDEPTLYINEDSIEMDVPARLVNDRTLVPIRAISESLGAKVDWDEESKVISISLAQEEDDSQVEYTMAEIAPSDVNAFVVNALTQRYAFEQDTLPKLFLGDDKTIANGILQNKEEIVDLIDSAWTKAMTTAIVRTQIDSKEDYVGTSELAKEGALYEAYLNILYQYNLRAGQTYNWSFEQIDKNHKALVLSFYSITDPVCCIQIALVVDNSLNCRYITAEVDAANENMVFMCEVDTKSRGTDFAIEVDDLNNYGTPEFIKDVAKVLSGNK